jgi:hypothetical protein
MQLLSDFANMLLCIQPLIVRSYILITLYVWTLYCTNSNSNIILYHQRVAIFIFFCRQWIYSEKVLFEIVGALISYWPKYVWLLFQKKLHAMSRDNPEMFLQGVQWRKLHFSFFITYICMINYKFIYIHIIIWYRFL